MGRLDSEPRWFATADPWWAKGVSFAPAFSACACLASPRSVNHLQAELDIARRVRLAGQLCVSAAGRVGVQAAEPHPVERIDELAPELQLHALFVQHGVLEKRHVPVVDGRNS